MREELVRESSLPQEVLKIKTKLFIKSNLCLEVHLLQCKLIEPLILNPSVKWTHDSPNGINLQED